MFKGDANIELVELSDNVLWKCSAAERWSCELMELLNCMDMDFVLVLLGSWQTSCANVGLWNCCTVGLRVSSCWGL